jgi:hypothetical protein
MAKKTKREPSEAEVRAALVKHIHSIVMWGFDYKGRSYNVPMHALIEVCDTVTDNVHKNIHATIANDPELGICPVCSQAIYQGRNGAPVAVAFPASGAVN